MQIYALDSKGVLISSLNAYSKQKYFCPECHSPVFVRGGPWVRRHFYHRLPPQHCKLAGKSLVHLQIQYALQTMLTKEQVFLEHPFLEIHRIADVAWPDQKIIFEVQCSPITAAEVSARNHDYKQLDYQVVWFLHDHRFFNQSRLTSAEAFLLSSPHYFTNMTPSGTGYFYDQYAQTHAGKRIQRTPRFPIHVKRLTRYPYLKKQVSHQFPKERRSWPLSFDFDLFHQEILFSTEEKRPKKWNFSFASIYRPFIDYLLKKETGSSEYR